MTHATPTLTRRESPDPAATQAWRRSLVLPLGFAAFKILLHLPFLHRFGIHHDELYFLACGRHPALGYVDHPPLVPWVARAVEELFGGAPYFLHALRLPAVLAGSAVLVLSLLLVQRLGGGVFAQWLVGLSMLAAPVFLRTHNMLTIPSFEPLIWLGVAHFLLTLVRKDRPRLWLAVGAICGAGLWVKHSTLFLGFGLALAILATPHRRHLRGPWLWAGGALALALFLPQLVWQAMHGWPTVEFLARLNDSVMADISKLQFTVGQLLYLNPVTAPVWILGLITCFRRPAESGERLFGWIWVGVIGLLFLIDSKIYYAAPAYPMLLAMGAVSWEIFARRTGRLWLRPALLGTVTAGFLVFLPLSLPMLPIDTTERYIGAVTFGRFENVYELTADLRGQFGWRERAEGVAEVWWSLSDEERESAVIVGDWYGPAGAVDLYGRDLGLPPAYSTHLSYHLWRTPPEGTEMFVMAGETPEDLAEFFHEFEVVRTVEVPQANAWQRRFPISVARRPKADVTEVWPALREY